MLFFSVLLQSMHSHRIRHEATKIAITLLIFMTLITLLWFSIALFWQHVFTRIVQQKIKAPVKVNPFSGFCFLIGHDCCALTSQYLAEQAPGCMNIRHFMTSSLFRLSILGGTQLPYNFSRINLDFVQIWFFFLSIGSKLQFFVFP